MTTTALKTINKTWPSVAEYLSVPHDEKSYRRLADFLGSLVDEIGDNEEHPMASLMETVGVLIAEYEETRFPVKTAGGVEALKYLMEEHGMKQGDLSEIGSQGVVSEILRGKRELNLRQVKILARIFNVSPAVFIQ